MNENLKETGLLALGFVHEGIKVCQIFLTNKTK